MVVVHFRFGEAAVPVRLVRLVVLDVGEAVVQLLVVPMVGFVVFVVLFVRYVGGFWAQIVVEFVLGDVDGRGFQSGWRRTRGCTRGS